MRRRDAPGRGRAGLQARRTPAPTRRCCWGRGGATPGARYWRRAASLSSPSASTCTLPRPACCCARGASRRCAATRPTTPLTAAALLRRSTPVQIPSSEDLVCCKVLRKFFKAATRPWWGAYVGQVAERGLDFVRHFSDILAACQASEHLPPLFREAWAFSACISLSQAPLPPFYVPLRLFLRTQICLLPASNGCTPLTQKSYFLVLLGTRCLRTSIAQQRDDRQVPPAASMGHALCRPPTLLGRLARAGCPEAASAALLRLVVCVSQAISRGAGHQPGALQAQPCHRPPQQDPPVRPPVASRALAALHSHRP